MICLNMIVKDEAPVIRRSLSSVKDLIDYWVIVDTGSTDGTQNIIREFMKDIPGELHERPWKNFEHNRNEALSLAKNKGEYLLFIDADEELAYPELLKDRKLTKDYYFAPVKMDDADCLRVLLIKTALDWRWKGVMHEELVCLNAQSFETLEKVAIMAHFRDGHRSQDPKKFIKDAQVLEEALVKDPTNARYVSFLAQSYLCAKDFPMALKNFQRRIAMGGREEEVFWSLYQTGCMQEVLNYPAEEIIKSYCKAFEFRPSRAEPLFRLGCYYYNMKNYVLGYAVAKLAVSIPCPNDIVHVEKSVYDFRLSFLLANCAFYLGKSSEAISLYKEILSKKNVPAALEKEVTMNLLLVDSHVKNTSAQAQAQIAVP